MKEEEKELWLDVQGYEGLYKVSNLGNIFSIKRNRLMTPQDNGLGYQIIGLTDCQGKRKFLLVHRLVAEAFLKNPNNFDEINHINENKSDNRVYNLEYCNRAYNIRFGTGIQRGAMTRSRQYEQLDKDGNHIATFTSGVAIERMLGFKRQNIYTAAKHGRIAYNFKWRKL